MSRFNGKRAEFEASGEKINVAILGAGRIAHTMAGTLTQMAEDSRMWIWCISPPRTVCTPNRRSCV